MTETTKYADVVLPAAIWGEKTGCFTNVGRTVHMSHKAVEPPGEAKSDFDIFIDYSTTEWTFRDKDGAPLIKWNTPEEAFEAWKACTKGRPCDYTGMSYAKLTGGSGIQWPCNEQYPDGTHHIYTDGVFNTAIEQCETYGHDLDTGAAVTEEEYKAKNPNGKAFLKGQIIIPPHEMPDEEYPLWLTTGQARVSFSYPHKNRTVKSNYTMLHRMAYVQNIGTGCSKIWHCRRGYDRG